MPSGIYDRSKLKNSTIAENWNQYKDLEYYPDRICKCGCGGRIKVQKHHKYCGIPEYINSHGRRGNGSAQQWVRDMDVLLGEIFCACGCGGRIKIKSYHKRYGIPKYISGHQAKHHPPGKGSTYAELYGVEKALSLRENLCRKQTGVKPSKETLEKLKEKAKRGDENPAKRPEVRAKIKAAKLGKSRPEMVLLWQDPEWKEKQIKAIFKGQKLLPNKPEKFLIKLFQELFPNQWKYIGDGKDENSIIAGKCPDFVHVNQKKIIEHFGDYHHGEKVTGVSNDQHEQERIDCFAQYGYQTLIIWEHELKNIDVLQDKLLVFMGK